MYRKRWVCLCLSVFFFGLFLAVGIAGPILIEKMIQSQVNDQMIMKESNADTWGLVPGHTHVHINREFFFFNLSNPDEVTWQGAKPTIAQLFEPYRYLEVDHYMERIYVDDSEADQDYVRFRRYTWYNKTEDWTPGISENDLVTQINIGVLSAWNQMKRLPPETIGLAALYSIISGLDGVLLPSAIAQGIAATFYTFIGTYYYEVIFQPAGITEASAKLLWTDPLYGWGNMATLPIWIQAEMQCFTGTKCVYTPALGGATYILKEYFGLTDLQMQGLLTGWLETSYQFVALTVKNAFDCPDEYCDPHFLTALQWSQQGVTNNPPVPSIPALPSVASLNSTITGFPEISYFLVNHYPKNSPLAAVTFTTEEALSLLDYNLATGWPSGSNFTLLDVGHIGQFFALGRLGDFAGIMELLDLSSVGQAQVLFDYINTLIAVTALQGRTDQNTYNSDNRGLTNELSLANLLSQTMTQLYNSMSDGLAVELTARYAFAVFTSDVQYKTTCAALLTSLQLPSTLCAGPALGWNIPSSLDLWVLTNWNGPGSSYWLQFQLYSGFTTAQMATLFGANSPLTIALGVIDTRLHAWYACHNPGFRCSHNELWIQQWGASNITNNLPAPLLGFPLPDGTKMENSMTLLEWGEPFASALAGPPEYSYFTYINNYTKANSNATIWYEAAAGLLNSMGLLNQVMCQRYFAGVFDIEVRKIPSAASALSAAFQVGNVTIFSTYLRKLVDKFAFGGLFITQSVRSWLWTGMSPLLVTLANTNPLQGGNPAVNPTQVQLGQNTTRASMRFPDHYKHAMITGKKDVESKLRWWFLFYGSPNISLYAPVYQGHTPSGPMLVYQNQNPWAEQLPILGGDALNFQTNVDSDSTVWLYLDPFLRSGQGSFDHKHLVSDMDVYRFVVANDLVANAQDNPVNAIYYGYGPSGVVNMTTVLGGPMFIGKPYFLGGESDTLLAVLDTTTPIADDLDIYDSYFDIEHFTGAVFSNQEKIMTGGELRSDALYPNLGSQGYVQEGIWTYLPIFFMNRSSYYPNERVLFT